MSEQIIIHGKMKYQCPNCGKTWFMGLEVGVEDRGRYGRPHQPCPFCILCECGGFANDISGYIPFPSLRSLYPGTRYFAYDNSGNDRACGKATVYEGEDVKNGQ